MSVKKNMVWVGALVILLILAFVSPTILGVLHHYTNFLVVGRSTTKIVGLLFWLLLIFVLPLLKLKIQKDRIVELFKRTLPILLLLSLTGTLFSLLLLGRHDLPLNTTLYAVSDTNFSFNHVFHSHILKPAVSPLSLFTSQADWGSAWALVVEQEFFFSPTATWIFYNSVFVILATLVIIGALYSITFESLSKKLAYAISIFVVLKSVVEGGLLAPDALLSLAALFIILKKPRWSLLTIPFLISGYFAWFTDDYISKNAIYAALLFSILIFSWKTSGEKIKYLKYSIGIISLASFFYFGAHAQFFGRYIFNPDDFKPLPANREIYFLHPGELIPEKTVLDNEMTVDQFVKKYSVDFESANESIKIDGVNCERKSFNTLGNRFRVVDLNLERLPRQLTLDDWYRGNIIIPRDGAYIMASMNSCLPNKFSRFFLFIKRALAPNGPAIVVSV